MSDSSNVYKLKLYGYDIDMSQPFLNTDYSVKKGTCYMSDEKRLKLRKNRKKNKKKNKN